MTRQRNDDEGGRKLNGLLQKVIHEVRAYFVEHDREKDSRRSHDVTIETMRRLERLATGRDLTAILARQLLTNATYVGVNKEVGEVLRSLDRHVGVKTSYGVRKVPTVMSTVPRDALGVPSGTEIYEKVFEQYCETIIDLILPIERKRRISGSARWTVFAEIERIAKPYYGQKVIFTEACRRQNIDPRQMQLKLNGTDA